MITEVREFAAQRKRIEVLNSLSSYVYGFKSQLGASEGQSVSVSYPKEKLRQIQHIVKAITTEWYSNS